MAKGTSKTKEVDSKDPKKKTSSAKKSAPKKKTSSSKTSPKKKPTTTKKKTTTKKTNTTRNTTSAKKPSSKSTAKKRTTVKKVPVEKLVDPKAVENRFEFTQKLPDMKFIEQEISESEFVEETTPEVEILEDNIPEEEPFKEITPTEEEPFEEVTPAVEETSIEEPFEEVESTEESIEEISPAVEDTPQEEILEEEKSIEESIEEISPAVEEPSLEESFEEDIPKIEIHEDEIPKEEKTRIKINIPNLIIEFVLLFVIIDSIYFTFYCINGRKVREKEYASLIQKKEVLQKELSELQEKEKVTLSELESYDHLDESIEETKKEYFSLIKQLEDDILAGKTNRKIAYLTFDDGPYYNTYRVFDILDQYGVKATFFTTNINGEYCYDNEGANCWIRYKEYVDRGHTIANHTYTHGIFRGLYSSTDAFMDAVDKQEALIKEQTGGYVTNILRFPGGSSTARGIKGDIQNRLRERGYGWVDWTANDGDGGNLTSSAVAWGNFTSTINDKMEVILYHDYNSITTDLLPDMIEYLQNNGYELYPLFYESHMIEK